MDTEEHAILVRVRGENGTAESHSSRFFTLENSFHEFHLEANNLVSVFGMLQLALNDWNTILK